jgi:hypothetical protein
MNQSDHPTQPTPKSSHERELTPGTRDANREFLRLLLAMAGAKSKKLPVVFSGSLSRPDEVRSDGLASPFWESKKVKLPVGNY